MIINFIIFTTSLVITMLYLSKIKPEWFLKITKSVHIDKTLMILTSLLFSSIITIIFIISKKYVEKKIFENYKKYHFLPMSSNKNDV
jgi:hypothetical protein